VNEQQASVKMMLEGDPFQRDMAQQRSRIAHERWARAQKRWGEASRNYWSDFAGTKRSEMLAASRLLGKPDGAAAPTPDAPAKDVVGRK
jgi:hypothetical protein